VLTGKDKPEPEQPNLSDPKVKTEIAQAILPLIDDVAQPTERETYRQQLARVLRIDELQMQGFRLAARRSAPARRSQEHGSSGESIAPLPAQAGAEGADSAPAPEQTPVIVSKLEAYCLGALLRQPEQLYKADRELQALGLPKLAVDDFTAVEHQLVFAALGAALEQVDQEPAEYVRAQLDNSLQPRLEQLLAAEAPPDAGLPVTAGISETRASETLMTAVLRLRKRAIGNFLRELRFLAEDAREQGDARAEAFQQEISRQAQALANVDKALARRGKRGDRLPQRLGLR
jgi:DNA primase